jgi:hypothetical protein
VLFGENVTPNLHKLAREFVLLDNFYVNADVSADGHNWSTAAIAPDLGAETVAQQYATAARLYDFEEQDPALPPAGYLWTKRRGHAGSRMRNYGYMVENRGKARRGAAQIESRDPVLAKVTNRAYRGFDLTIRTWSAPKVFLADLADYEKSGAMPRLMVMRLLGNDHTSGVAARAKLSPLSMAADNDTRWA